MKFIDRLKAKRVRKRRYAAMKTLRISNAELMAIRVMQGTNRDAVLVKGNGVMVTDHLPDVESDTTL